MKKGVVIVSGEEGNRVEHTDYVVYSYDKDSFKFVFYFPELERLANQQALLVIVGETLPRQRYNLTINDGKAEWMVPESLLGYEGHVKGYLHTSVNGQPLSDEDFMFTFSMKRSEMDKDVYQLQNTYYDLFDDAVEQIKLKAENTQLRIQSVFSDALETISATQDKIRSTDGTIDQELQEIYDDLRRYYSKSKSTMDKEVVKVVDRKVTAKSEIEQIIEELRDLAEVGVYSKVYVDDLETSLKNADSLLTKAVEFLNTDVDTLESNLTETNLEVTATKDEIIEARGESQTLGERLDSDKTEVTTQLAEKATKGQIVAGDLKVAANADRLKLVNLSDEVLQAMAGTTSVNSTPAALSTTSEKIEPGAVTPEKTSFLEASSNLYDKSKDVTGFSISGSTGQPVANTAYNHSDYVFILPSTAYSFYGFNAVARYDANKVFINRVDLLYPGQTITMPSNARFVRVHYQPNATPITTDGTKRRINLGDELQPYEPFTFYLDGVSFSSQQVKDIESRLDVAKLINPTDRIMFDVPIDGVFDSTEVYPDFSTFGNTTAAQVYQMFDDLMALYPDYISKTLLGDDAFGNPIALYEFVPELPPTSVTTRVPKAFITCGVHGYEKTPALTTYLMLKQMCESWEGNQLIEALRHNVHFLVIPVANPTGWNDYTRTNRNGVDINRNFASGWVQRTVGSSTYGGSAPFSEPESRYIRDVFVAHPDIDMMYDFHNFFGDSSTTNFIWIPTVAGAYVQHMTQNLVSRLTRKWKKEYDFILSDYFAGYSDSTHGGMVQDHAFSVGVKFTGTFEVCNRWWLQAGSQPYDETHKVTAVETLVNWILINLKEIEKSS